MTVKAARWITVSIFSSFSMLNKRLVSCTSPCIQGIADLVEAASMARQVNDELADTISNNTLRFGGFAALAMQNATEAAQELKRAVQELGFFGALVNDYQETNADGNSEWLF